MQHHAGDAGALPLPLMPHGFGNGRPLNAHQAQQEVASGHARALGGAADAGGSGGGGRGEQESWAHHPDNACLASGAHAGAQHAASPGATAAAAAAAAAKGSVVPRTPPPTREQPCASPSREAP